MKNILIVSAHPYEQISVANKEIIKLLQAKYPNAQLDNLNALYGNYQIDIKKEQEKLLWADVIILQTPLFWFGITSLAKRWLEEVFAHGWAYGSEGGKLAGKEVIVSITAGANHEAYISGAAGISADEILKSVKVSFEFCQMKYLGAVFTGSMLNTGTPTAEQRANIETLANKHCEELAKLLA